MIDQFTNSKPRIFCTLFDSNYLLKGLVMLRSLSSFCKDAHIYVLCMDNSCFSILEKINLSNVTLLTLNEVEDQDLLRVKPDRSIAEYCWTLSASLCWYLMSRHAHIDMITYLDADLMFFSDIEPLYEEIGNSSIAIIEHRFMPRLAHLEAYGRFNVEWVSFKRDEIGLRCLKLWRDQCIDWCYARLEDGRMGDQKYLDAWPDLFGNSVCILQHKGAGIAPWNFSNYSYSVKNSSIYVDGSPLIFYHFHQFQILGKNKFSHMSSVYSANDPIPLCIYNPYEDALKAALAEVRQFFPRFSGGFRSQHFVLLRTFAQRFVPIRAKNLIRRFVQAW